MTVRINGRKNAWYLGPSTRNQRLVNRLPIPTALLLPTATTGAGNS